MHTFEIKDQFLLDGKPFTILSGSIHYFRVHPSDWHHSLYNLKAMGFNTVETYVPWNLHEPRPGEFDFEGICDLDHRPPVAVHLRGVGVGRPARLAARRPLPAPALARPQVPCPRCGLL